MRLGRELPLTLLWRLAFAELEGIVAHLSPLGLDPNWLHGWSENPLPTQWVAMIGGGILGLVARRRYRGQSW